jgi:prophage antirepressor-like protein
MVRTTKKKAIVLRMDTPKSSDTSDSDTSDSGTSSETSNSAIFTSESIKISTKKKLISIKNETIPIKSKTKNPYTFKYGNINIFTIFAKDKKVWYRGNSICIILGYDKGRNAISTYISKEHKISHKDLISQKKTNELLDDTNKKIHGQTIFISYTGICQLITKKNKDESTKLLEFITEAIIPSIFSNNPSIPNTLSFIERLNKSFYEDNMISDYKNRLAVYLSYIGKYNGKHIMKFGKTNDFVTRDLKQHRKMYKQFNVIHIWESLANDFVESSIKDNFLSMGMLTALTKEELGVKCKGKNKRELIIIKKDTDLDYCLNMITSVITNTTLPQEQKYKETINEMKIKLLESEIEYLKEIIKQQKDNLHDLRNKSSH